MVIETIDLYEQYGKDRGNASGGYLTVYARTESKELKVRMRPAMLVLPGGGYSILSDREGEPIALEYLKNGFVSFVLSYSLKTPYPTPLFEAMLAVMYIRDNAEKFYVDKNKVCAIGFSAGGHLAGMLSTVKECEADTVGRCVRDVSPNAVILSYPVASLVEHVHIGTRDIISGGDRTLYEKLSVEKRIDGNSAPAFIWHTFEDNAVPAENSMLLASAYRKNNVPFELHIFEHGGHGLALCNDETNDFTAENKYLSYVGKWSGLSLDWLRTRGFAATVK